MNLVPDSILSMTPAAGLVTFTSPDRTWNLQLIGFAVVVTACTPTTNEPGCTEFDILTDVQAVVLDKTHPIPIPEYTRHLADPDLDYRVQVFQ